MSNLGAVGSSDYQPQEPEEAPLQKGGPITLESQREQTLKQVVELSQSNEPGAQTKAMKMLIALMSKGHNVVDFCPFVVQMVANRDPVTRQLAYVFLNHYAEEAPDVVMLSVNTFQRSLTDSDPIVRALSIKVMSSIKLKDNLPAIFDAVNQVIGDPSPYVKKAAAFAMIKACELEPNEIENYLPLIERLLADSSPIAFSGAIAAYWSLCPDNIDMLHPHFRYMCQNISKFDEYAQLFIIRALTIYSRYCFKNPENEEVDESAAAFWDDGPQKDTLSGDHLMLIHAAKRLLQSPNSAVVLAAVAYLFYCAPTQHVASVAKPLVRLLYDGPTSAEIALTTILTIVAVHQHVFVPHLSHFYVRKSDTLVVKQLKLQVLCALASQSNAELVLNELASYSGSPDNEFASTAVKTMGRTAMQNEAIIPMCLVTLLRLMSRAKGSVLAEVVLVLATILRKRRGTDDEAQALKHLCRKFVVINDGAARAAVLSIVGDMHETHPEFAPQLLRYIAQNFEQESAEVRLQALTLAAKLVVLGTESQVPMYLLKICERDTEFDVRDRARFLVALLETTNEKIKNSLKELLFPARKPPKWTTVDSSVSQYQIGTFSHLFSREVSGYEPLPEWAEESELPPDSVRTQIKKLPDGTTAEVKEIENGSDEGEIGIEDFFSDDGGAEEDEEEAQPEYYDDDEAAGYYEYEDDAEAAPAKAPAKEQEPEDDEDLDDFFA